MPQFPRLSIAVLHERAGDPFDVHRADLQIRIIGPETSRMILPVRLPRFPDPHHLARRFGIEGATAFAPALSTDLGQITSNVVIHTYIITGLRSGGSGRDEVLSFRDPSAIASHRGLARPNRFSASITTWTQRSPMRWGSPEQTSGSGPKTSLSCLRARLEEPKDARETDQEPDWSEHRGVIERSRLRELDVT